MQQVTNARTVTHLKKKEKVVKEEASEVGSDLIDRPLATIRHDETIGLSRAILHDETTEATVHLVDLGEANLRANQKRFAECISKELVKRAKIVHTNITRRVRFSREETVGLGQTVSIPTPVPPRLLSPARIRRTGVAKAPRDQLALEVRDHLAGHLVVAVLIERRKDLQWCAWLSDLQRDAFRAF